MREYECMLILAAEADEAVVSTATERISAMAAKHGGEVRSIERWGRRRLAYEIDHHGEGYYVVVTFSAEPGAQLELERALNLADEIVRHKILALPPPRKKREKDQKELATSPASAGGGDETPQGE